MYNCLKGVLCCVFLSFCAVNAQEYLPGEFVPEIRCAKDSDYSYILYLPKGYDSSREEKWPVMFVMSPNGGHIPELRRYVQGADLCGWILAMSMQSKNYYDHSTEAVSAMVDDVFDRFPVNKKRCYTSGFSGGARMAFKLSNQMPDSVLGIIPCGAGDSGDLINSRVLVYGWSGASCPNREEMARTFVQRVKKRGMLRFCPGGHAWSEPSHFLKAMVWMNGKYFEKQRRANEEELAKFSGRLLAAIKTNRENNPACSYEFCRILTDMKKAPDVDEGGEIMEEIGKEPALKTYLEAMEDIDEFSERYFNSGRGNTEDAEKAALQLAEKHKNTPYVELLTDLAKPASW